MRIFFAASECVPFAKTGGLADVVGALAPELAGLGHDVTVFLPLYASVRRQIGSPLHFTVRDLRIPFQHRERFASLVDGGRRGGAQVYFVDCPELFERSGLYGEQG
ncbi:MAG: glycogen/starch synthase, partial [Terracidiphilus sp.]